MAAPIIAHPLGLFDCCGVSDGSACAIVTTPEIAKSLGKKDIVSVKAIQLAVSSGYEGGFNEWDGEHFVTTSKCSTKAYEEAGITNPREEISMMELHDCFSITELVTYEDLHISERGHAWKDALDGFYDRDGKVPAQVDGGLKCFGHPIGASGLRMIYEMYLQLLGRAERAAAEKSPLRPHAQPGRLPAPERLRDLDRRPLRELGDFCLDMVCHKCYTSLEGERTMPTKNPRVNIVVEPPLYSVMHDIATSEGVSMSTVARDLIREAIELREDVALADFADTRMKTLDRKKALSHDDVWK